MFHGLRVLFFPFSTNVRLTVFAVIIIIHFSIFDLMETFIAANIGVGNVLRLIKLLFGTAESGTGDQSRFIQLELHTRTLTMHPDL